MRNSLQFLLSSAFIYPLIEPVSTYAAVNTLITVEGIIEDGVFANTPIEFRFRLDSNGTRDRADQPAAGGFLSNISASLSGDVGVNTFSASPFGISVFTLSISDPSNRDVFYFSNTSAVVIGNEQTGSVTVPALDAFLIEFTASAGSFDEISLATIVSGLASNDYGFGRFLGSFDSSLNPADVQFSSVSVSAIPEPSNARLAVLMIFIFVLFRRNAVGRRTGD
ncbi:MAG: hypothetical protein ACSHYA_18485 [Opitutaceae bacterium]